MVACCCCCCCFRGQRPLPALLNIERHIHARIFRLFVLLLLFLQHRLTGVSNCGVWCPLSQLIDRRPTRQQFIFIFYSLRKIQSISCCFLACVCSAQVRDMQQAEDSELIASMKQRLRQLQERRRQLLNSRRIEEEELALREPVTVQIADVMRSVYCVVFIFSPSQLAN